jgi:hypothetical protein
MATSTSPRLLVELSAHSVQLLALDASARLTGYAECALEAAAVTAALAQIGAEVNPGRVQARIVPAAGFVVRAKPEEAGKFRSVQGLLARAQAVAQAEPAAFQAVAFDSCTGVQVDALGSVPWVIEGTGVAQLESAQARLESLGLRGAELSLAFPARIGAVVMALQDLPESTRVLVWQIGENTSQLACVCAAGCEAVATFPIGCGSIFEAVQAGLGLRFRAAATKLFFNADYDFTDAAGAIAERLAVLLRPAIASLGVTPTSLYVVGLPNAQAWLTKALASALEIDLLAPDIAAFAAQRNLSGPALASGLPATSLGLLVQAAERQASESPWLPRWLDATAPVVASAPATAPAVPVVIAAPAKPVPVPAGAVAAKTVTQAPSATADAGKSVAPVAPVKNNKAKPVAPVPPAAETAVEAQPEAATPVVAAKKPVALLAAVAGVVVLGGLGAVLFLGKGKTDAVPAVPVATVPAAPAAPVVSAEELKIKEQEKAFALVQKLSASRSFRNEKYSFEVSERGYLTRITDSNNRVLVDQLGWLELVGNADGGKGKAFRAANSDTPEVSVAFNPSITRSVRDGKEVFEINVTNSKFTLSSLITCLPNSISVEAVFKPLKMAVTRGQLSLDYAIKLNAGALGSKPFSGGLLDGAAKFTTVEGPLVVKFDKTLWQPKSDDNKKQVVKVYDGQMVFNFVDDTDPNNNVLKMEMILP